MEHYNVETETYDTLVSCVLLQEQIMAEIEPLPTKHEFSVIRNGNQTRCPWPYFPFYESY